MSLEDIKTITESEKKAAGIRTQALNDAKQLISDAERKGKAYAEQARAEAESRVKTLMEDAEKTADRHGSQNRTESQKRCESLESAANARLDEAAAKIVERIVNS